jgi:hypothetical protein
MATPETTNIKLAGWIREASVTLQVGRREGAKCNIILGKEHGCKTMGGRRIDKRGKLK